MSHSILQDVRCPCGEDFEADLWSSVNAVQTPELKDEILAGQLNVMRCPRCGQMVYGEHFLLYHDPAAQLMVFVYPLPYEKEAEKWLQKTRDDFAAARSALKEKERLTYGPATVFGMDALVELLAREQEWADQGEIVKAEAASLGLEVFHVKPSVAREKGAPLFLPLSKDRTQTIRKRLLAGLGALNAANDRLDVYSKYALRLASSHEEDVSFVSEV